MASPALSPGLAVFVAGSVSVIAAGLPGNSYIGPDGFMEQRGYPRLVDRSAAAKNRDDAIRLWDVSEQLTGVRYPFDVA